MPTLISRPLVACTTNEDKFSDRVEAAANEIGSDYWSSENLDLTLQQCDNRLSCVVVDFENAAACKNKPHNQRLTRVSRSLIAVVPAGDVWAAFCAADMGAVTVIEKSNLSNELVVNLKTALASETRIKEFRTGPKRFSDPVFAKLTAREKAILSLLMDGEPNKRVAAILDVGLRTVEAERAQIIKKLNVGSFVELIKLVACIENDVLETRKNIFGSIFPRERSFPI
jgi:FixJ family two-component response regulator